MTESGDWVTPRLYGKTWFEKPVLYYWSAALSFKALGVSDTAARLPSAVAALIATLGLAWLAWRIYGTETARWLLLFLPSMVGMIGFSHAAATDMPFAASLTMALIVQMRLLDRTVSTSSARIVNSTAMAACVFGFFAGLAVLAKGPAAIILIGGPALCWAFFTGRWRDALRCLHPVAVVAFCSTALPWYILCERRNPDFLHVFIVEHNFKRFLTPEFQHVQPFWFYIPVLLIAVLPWSLVLLWAVFVTDWGTLWRRRSASPGFFLLLYALFCLMFFSVSQSKLPGYILPAIPPIGLLLSRSYVRLGANLENSFRWTISAFAMIALPFGISLIVLARRLHLAHANPSAMIATGCLVLGFALANLLLTLREEWHGIDLACAAPLPILCLLLAFPALSHPWLRYDPSGKTLASEIASAQVSAEQLFAGPHMKRGQLYSLSFYLHQEIKTWEPNQPDGGYLLLSAKDCAAVAQAPWRCSENPIVLQNSGWFAYRVRRTN